MISLSQIELQGFRSIRNMSLELRNLNVLVGANGAGKSNLVSFFKLLSEMMGARFQQHVAEAGRAHSLLYFGPQVTPAIAADLEFDSHYGVFAYSMRLTYAAGDSLVFANENISEGPISQNRREILSVGEGHLETKVLAESDLYQSDVIGQMREFLSSCRVYHFNDTSMNARVRGYSYVDDSAYLRQDAGNLSAYLQRIRRASSPAYNRILRTISLIAPYFRDFVLDPSPHSRDMMLNWRQQGSDEIFGPHQISDGTLRAMCLCTLLLQPEEWLPKLLIVDEPELGLHPYALGVISALFQKASHYTQIMVSTQSSTFLDHFDPEDVVVVDRDGPDSVFSRKGAPELEAWLEEYSLGEVWEKNILGGGPH